MLNLTNQSGYLTQEEEVLLTTAINTLKGSINHSYSLNTEQDNPLILYKRGLKEESTAYNYYLSLKNNKYHSLTQDNYNTIIKVSLKYSQGKDPIIPQQLTNKEVYYKIQQLIKRYSNTDTPLINNTIKDLNHHNQEIKYNNQTINYINQEITILQDTSHPQHQEILNKIKDYPKYFKHKKDKTIIKYHIKELQDILSDNIISNTHHYNKIQEIQEDTINKINTNKERHTASLQEQINNPSLFKNPTLLKKELKLITDYYNTQLNIISQYI